MTDTNKPAPTFNLTASQIEFFHREGYLALEPITTQEEVGWLRGIYDRLFEARAGWERGDAFDLGGVDDETKQPVLPQILNPVQYAPELAKAQILTNARRILEQLFESDEVNCNFAHLIYKPARIGASTPWHQDAAYWNGGNEPRTLSIWVPLQEATLENGCMQFVPGSHREKHIYRHQSINNDPRIHGLELHPDEMSRIKGAVACPLAPGGATVHGGYTFHYTGPNRSEVPRRAAIIMGGLPPLKRAVPVALPWMEEKKTGRLERAMATRGADVQPGR